MSSLDKPRPTVGKPARGDTDELALGVTGGRRAVISLGTRLFNPLTRRFAGSRWFPLFALVRHRGRRSGRVYATPVGARPTPDGFVIPLTFGTSADWFRNVQAAGGCVVRWRGAEYPVVAPAVVDWATARSAAYPAERIALPLLGITRFAQLRHAHLPASEHDEPAAPTAAPDGVTSHR